MIIFAITLSCLCFVIYYILKNGTDDIIIMIIMNILCNFIAVYILSKIRNKYSKAKLKEDKICDDFLESIYQGIEKFEEIKKIMPRDTDWSNLNYEKEIKFYYESGRDYFIYCYCLVDDNKEILLDSVKNSFFIELNFKLMGIINKIKLYKSIVKKDFDYRKLTYNKYERDKGKFLELSEYEQYKILYDYDTLLTYTRHLINGWKDLLKYLDYSYEENEYIKRIKENRFYMTELQYKYLKYIYEKGEVDVGEEVFNVPEQNFEGIMLYGFAARKFITIKGENNTKYAEITELGKEALNNFKENKLVNKKEL